MKFLPRLFLLAAFCCSARLAHAEDPPPTRLKYGAWGFDLAGRETATKPGDDFFRYANGTWLDKTQIPPDKPAYSLRLAMSDLTEQRLHDMMESLGAKPNDNPRTLEEEVGARLDTLLTVLEFIDRVELRHKSEDGRIFLTLTVTPSKPLRK